MESSRNRESGMEVGAWPRHVTALIRTLGMHVACGPAAWLMVAAQAGYRLPNGELSLLSGSNGSSDSSGNQVEEAVSFILLSNMMMTLSSFPSCLF